MNLIIRYYNSSDFKTLIRLLENVYGSHINQVTLENNYISDKRSILVAVTENDTVVGCAFTEVQEDFVRSSRILYVTYVAVDENYRKIGIGRTIFERIEKICSENTCSAIELTSADFRTEAHEFYNRLGFAKKKTTVFIKEI